MFSPLQSVRTILQCPPPQDLKQSHTSPPVGPDAPIVTDSDPKLGPSRLGLLQEGRISAERKREIIPFCLTTERRGIDQGPPTEAPARRGMARYTCLPSMADSPTLSADKLRGYKPRFKRRSGDYNKRRPRFLPRRPRSHLLSAITSRNLHQEPSQAFHCLLAPRGEEGSFAESTSLILRRWYSSKGEMRFEITVVMVKK